MTQIMIFEKWLDMENLTANFEMKENDAKAFMFDAMNEFHCDVCTHPDNPNVFFVITDGYGEITDTYRYFNW